MSALNALVILASPVLGGIGTLGVVGELAGKALPDSTFKKASIVFAKTIQNASAALSLSIIGLLTVNPVLLPVLPVILVTVCVVPTANALVQSYGSDGVKKVFYGIDLTVDVLAKITNVASLALGIYFAPLMLSGLSGTAEIAGNIFVYGGAPIAAALSTYTFLKKA